MTDLRQKLTQMGASVVEPAPFVALALELVQSGTRIDGAILDVLVADLLWERWVPFLFITGNDQSMISDGYAKIVRCEKPVQLARLRRALTNVMARAE